MERLLYYKLAASCKLQRLKIAQPFFVSLSLIFSATPPLLFAIEPPTLSLCKTTAALNKTQHSERGVYNNVYINIDIGIIFCHPKILTP